MKTNLKNWRAALASLRYAWERFWTKRSQRAIERRNGGRIRFVDEPLPFLVDPVARKIDWIGSPENR